MALRSLLASSLKVVACEGVAPASAGTGALLASSSARLLSTSSAPFAATPLLLTHNRIALKKPDPQQTYRVATKKKPTKIIFVGKKGSDGRYVRPPQISAELQREDRDKNAKVAFGRSTYSDRKRFLVKKYQQIFDAAKVVVCVQPAQAADFAPFRTELMKEFKSVHIRNGLVHLEGKSYAGLKALFRGPTKVLFHDDPARMFSSLATLKRVLRNHPGVIFLGGAVDGQAAISHDMEELTSFTSKEQIQASVIPYLQGHMQMIPALQSATMSLTKILHHHAGQLEKAASVGALPGAAPAAQ